jgi:ubiquinone/menaquinone biosynthesis C-methylase UbiE
MSEPQSGNPWDWMQPHDIARLGAAIADREEQTRWCRAVMLGGLPYMWRRQAETVRRLMYDKLAAKPGDSVLIIGESIESCGFTDDIRQLIGAGGQIHAVDITDEARDAYFTGKRGARGELATWRWTYTREFPDGYFDCVAILQAVQHADDWREVGKEMLRVMKSGRNILLAEITFGPKMRMLAEQDIHISYWMEKIFAGVGFNTDKFSYYSPQDLEAAFADQLVKTGWFEWKGVELFWGTKP